MGFNVQMYSVLKIVSVIWKIMEPMSSKYLLRRHLLLLMNKSLLLYSKAKQKGTRECKNGVLVDIKGI